MKEATVAEIERALGAMTEAEQHSFKVSLCVEAGRHDLAVALAARPRGGGRLVQEIGAAFGHERTAVVREGRREDP